MEYDLARSVLGFSARSGPSDSSRSRRESSDSSDSLLERTDGEYIGDVALRGDLRVSNSVAFGVGDVMRVREWRYKQARGRLCSTRRGKSSEWGWEGWGGKHWEIRVGVELNA